jgi:hypothetical protein
MHLLSVYLPAIRVIYQHIIEAGMTLQDERV